MKRTLALILALVMIVGMIPMSVFADETTPTLTFTHDVTDVSTLKAGDTFTVTATLTNNPGFAAFQFDLDWDNTVVQFDGFSTEEFRGVEFLVSDVIVSSEYDQTTGIIVVGESENITTSGKLFEANFTVLKEGDADITYKKTWPDFELKTAAGTDVAHTVNDSDLEQLTIKHTHSYSSVVTAPTCTAGGYTTYTCTCGDSYTGDNTAATGHTPNPENKAECKDCGTALTVIPEGAKFIEITTDKGEIVNVTETDGFYKVEVPYGTTTLMVTYPEELPVVDEFGYVKTKMTGFDGVSDDGYNKTQKDGKITVGLHLVKSPASPAPIMLRLINLDGQFSKKVTICMNEGGDETFALTYMLDEGEYLAELPVPEDCLGYTITGEPIASNGYTFTVALAEGYQADSNFAVKVNGETVASAPGEITLNTVTGNIAVTVEGVSKEQNNTTDVIFNVDLSEAPDGMSGDIMIQDKNYNFIEEPFASGNQATAAITASDHEYTKVRVYGVNESLITGWEVNGTVYPAGGKQYVGDLTIWNRGYYLQVEYNGTTPITVNIKPVVSEPQPKTYTVSIADNIVGGTVTASKYEDVAENEEITLTAVADEGYTFASFDVKKGEETITVTDGKFSMPAGDVTVSANFTKIPNPIQAVEAKNPLLNKTSAEDATAPVYSVTLMSGVTEDLLLDITVENPDKEATQQLTWSSTNEAVAKVEDGKLITGTVTESTTVILTATVASEAAAAAIDGEGSDALITLNVTVNPVDAGYTVTMGADVENTVIGSTVSVPVTIGHTDTAVTQYSAYDMSFTYDPAVLKLATFGTEITDVKDENGNSTGTIHVEHYGDKTDNGTALTLIFEAIATGETNVKVTAAKVDISESALTQDAPDASILDNITLVSVTGYTIELNEDFTGATSILPGETYVFEAKDKNYTYDFSDSTMGGQSVTVTEIKDENGNGTGKYQIENVSGNIVINSEKTGKTFKVTLTGDGIAPAEGFTSGENAAQYTVAYKAQLAEIDKWNYSYTVTIGGKEYTDYTVKDGVITISGEDITGEIVITVTRTAVTQDKHQVDVEGATGDVDINRDPEVENGQDYTFTVNKVAGFKYTVTATMDGQPVEVIDNGDGTYTIKNVTGNLKINVQKEYIMTVEVVENYVKVEGKSMFLVLAETAVDTGKVLSYDGTPMFYTTKYSQQTDGADAAGKWAYLVFTETTLSEDEAKAEITLADVSESVIKVTLDQTFNVNESGITDGDSIGTVDINDAQLVYDMYNAVYENFENGATMQKFLKADVNNDRKVDVNDAMAIVDEIIKAK